MSRSRTVSRANIALCPSTRASKLSNIPLPSHLSRSDINSILAGDQQPQDLDMQRLSLRLSRMEAGQARIEIYTRQLLQWEFTNVSEKNYPLTTRPNGTSSLVLPGTGTDVHIKMQDVFGGRVNVH
ncbi:hypothetical protein D6C93_09136 [Aureobasidium pullulans]|nr:hypothetical protein D6C93_09136 [Aureobasidium pullulans]